MNCQPGKPLRNFVFSASSLETINALPVLSVSALPVLSVSVLLRSCSLPWFPAQVWWSSAPSWSSQVWWSSALPWWSSGQGWWSSAPPWWAPVLSAPPWWAPVTSAPPWWAPAPPALPWGSSAWVRWSSALPWRTSAPPWWAPVPSAPHWWAPVPSAPPWWAPVPSTPPWLPALPQSTATPLPRGPGPPSLPLFRLRSTALLDCIGASGSRSLGGGGGVMSRILSMHFRSLTTRGHPLTGSV